MLGLMRAAAATAWPTVSAASVLPKATGQVALGGLRSPLGTVREASKKAGGSSKNGRKTAGRRLGLKKSDGTSTTKCLLRSDGQRLTFNPTQPGRSAARPPLYCGPDHRIKGHSRQYFGAPTRHQVPSWRKRKSSDWAWLLFFGNSRGFRPSLLYKCRGTKCYRRSPRAAVWCIFPVTCRSAWDAITHSTLSRKELPSTPQSDLVAPGTSSTCARCSHLIAMFLYRVAFLLTARDLTAGHP